MRKLRLKAFAVAAEFPIQMPYFKIAALKYSYACDPKDGWCPVPDGNKVKKLFEKSPEFCNTVEATIQYLHDAAKHTTGFMKAQFLGTVDKKIAQFVFAQKNTMDTDKALGELGEIIWTQAESLKGLHALLPDKPELKLAEPLPVPMKEPQKKASQPSSSRGSGADKKAPEIHPRLIQYDSAGNPVTTQETKEVKKVVRKFEIPWHKWQQSEVTQKQFRTQKDEAYAFLCAASPASAQCRPFGESASSNRKRDPLEGLRNGRH